MERRQLEDVLRDDLQVYAHVLNQSIAGAACRDHASARHAEAHPAHYFGERGAGPSKPMYASTTVRCPNNQGLRCSLYSYRGAWRLASFGKKVFDWKETHMNRSLCGWASQIGNLIDCSPAYP
jgi:hypothetical protein